MLLQLVVVCFEQSVYKVDYISAKLVCYCCQTSLPEQRQRHVARVIGHDGPFYPCTNLEKSCSL